MNNEIKTIKPFRNFCITIGALPTSYLESMSYYEMLCWLCKYLENTINPAINQNAEALKELQEYVANYFDNLDVQEEINNKLDEMADDGTLAQIINVEMIGTLNELVTTDKTDLVSAINEVSTTSTTNITAISNYLNLNSFTQYNYNQFSYDTGTLASSSHITVARNTDGTLCKIYGTFHITDIDSYGSKNIELNIDTGLRPETEITIESGFGFTFSSGNLVGIGSTYITVKTNGNLVINYYSGGTPIDIIFPACLLLLKDFGDTPNL